MSRAMLVIINGAPGAGKTTLGRRLAKDLELPFLSKDDIKECLFGALGWSDRAWSMKLGRASVELLFRCWRGDGRLYVFTCHLSPVSQACYAYRS